MLTRRKMLGMAAGIPLLGGLFGKRKKREKKGRICPESSDSSEYEVIWDEPENGVKLCRTKPFGPHGFSIKILSINVRQLVKASRGRDRFEVVVGREYQKE